MACTEYGSITLYVESRTSLVAKIQAIENIEAAILIAILDQASGAGVGIAMYELDDGQVRIKTNYRSSQDITAALNALNLVKQRYIRQLQGSTINLRSAATVNRGGGFCC